MSTSKHFDRVCALIVALGLLITVLFVNGEALGIEKIVDEDAEGKEGTAMFTANDLDGAWDASNPTAVITLNGGSASVKGGGAYANGGSVTITNAGWYVLSGSLDDGSIIVDAYNSSKVFLLLSGVSLYRSDDACLRVEQAEKVFLTLAEGSENTMESGETYSEAALADNTGGVIFAHDDLTINGSGSLTLTAKYKHGVDANDDLRVTGGTIAVTAPQDGFHVNDSFRLTGASVTINAGDDAVHADEDIYIESGKLLVESCYEGLEAKRVDIAGGDILIYPSDDGINAGSGGGGDMFGGMGGPGGMGGGRRDWSGEEGEMPPQWNGENGEEGQQPEMGQRPDGDGGERPTMGVMGSSSETDEDIYIRISGGSVMIINPDGRDADGLDSNKDIYISGGTILISVPSSGSNAIDFASESGGKAVITGGTVIACGSSMMAESFDSASTQPSIFYFGSGNTVTLTDASGKELLNWTPPVSFTAVFLSCPELTLGESYRLSLGDTAEEITLSEVAGSYGSAQSGGFGGMGGGPGGMGGFGKGGRGNRGGNAAETETTDK